jgi:cytosine/adenosine deaminase-related metal-dependent hydrolase
MLLRADIILAGDGEVLHHGAVRLTEGHLTAVAPAEALPPLPDEEVVDLPGQILSPGLINAHCHLDYTDMGGLMPTRHFTKWIRAINGLKRSFTNEDYLKAIARGFTLLLESGVTTVANVEAFPELLPHLPPPPLRTWWFLEMIDLRTRNHEEESLLGMWQFFEQHPTWLGGFGLSPHAPYTASIDLYRLAKRWTDVSGMLMTTHIAESREESEMFLYGTGEMHSFLQELGRDVSDCGQGSPFSHLHENNVLSAQCLAVHMNYLQEYDFPLVVNSGVSVVHCPKCHEFFKHGRFPLERLRALGVNVCLGTDSLASNTTLDLRSEIRQAQIHHPEIEPLEWWRMITLNGAKALGQAGQLGEIRPGARADLVAFPREAALDPFQSIIESRGQPTFLMVNGVPLIFPPS